MPLQEHPIRQRAERLAATLPPLLMAAEEGHSEVVALLLKFGASLEATDDSGSGPGNGVGSCSQVKGREKI